MKGKVTDSIEWLSANEEDNASIAQANAPLDSKGHFVNDFVLCRARGEMADAHAALPQPREVGSTIVLGSKKKS